MSPQFFDLINRLGIILNFIAGFMLAPELLGIERLKRVEIKLEKVLSFLIKGVRKVLSIFSIEDDGSWRGHFIGTVILCLLQYALIILFDLYKSDELKITLMLAIYSSILLIRRQEIKKKISDLNNNCKIKIEDIQDFVIQPLAASFTLITGIAILPLGIIAILLLLHIFIEIPLGYVMRKLQDGEQLQSVLIWWGIIFFITGNLAQLFATFKPS